MRVTHEKPFARGVTQLMYVGDDAALEGSTAEISTPIKVAIVAVIGWLLLRRR
jgi:hypothetical protein